MSTTFTWAIANLERKTKETVIDWVLSTLGVDQVVSIEEALHNQIQQKLHPTSASGTPW